MPDPNQTYTWMKAPPEMKTEPFPTIFKIAAFKYGVRFSQLFSVYIGEL